MDEVILSRIRQEAYEQGYQDGKVDGYNLAETRISSVKQERKHGEWIKVDKDNRWFVPHILKCSVCGNMLDKHGVNAGRGDANFCPNCGSYNGEESDNG